MMTVTCTTNEIDGSWAWSDIAENVVRVRGAAVEVDWMSGP